MMNNSFVAIHTALLSAQPYHIFLKKNSVASLKADIACIFGA